MTELIKQARTWRRKNDSGCVVGNPYLTGLDYGRVARHPTGTNRMMPAIFPFGLATVDQIIDLG